eukprot:354470-Chlamydomonas_euryale.AAC.7
MHARPPARTPARPPVQLPARPPYRTYVRTHTDTQASTHTCRHTSKHTCAACTAHQWASLPARTSPTPPEASTARLLTCFYAPAATLPSTCRPHPLLHEVHFSTQVVDAPHEVHALLRSALHLRDWTGRQRRARAQKRHSQNGHRQAKAGTGEEAILTKWAQAGKGGHGCRGGIQHV